MKEELPGVTILLKGDDLKGDDLEGDDRAGNASAMGVGNPVSESKISNQDS